MPNSPIINLTGLRESAIYEIYVYVQVTINLGYDKTCQV